ncbi:MAG: serine protease [Bacteroidetes bacterium]|nr:MAG: serine protease [Bacteroidota bacterium]
MKKFVVISFALLLGFLPQLRADEGMWIPSLISKNIAIMQKLGCQLTAEEIYSNTSPSIKDAIIIFGGGCTGEIVSPEGLIFTNHHCGFGSIQKVSTVEHDYLKDGFWAYSKDKEIPIEGLTVKFLVYMKDVTGQALDSVTNTMSEKERSVQVRKNIKNIEAAASKDNDYSVVVKPIFGGNQYYIYVYNVFKDIRFVGAPPSAVGKFGGDTDNWMWPRHTGDFSIFRVYTAPDGSPAEYSADNIPMKSKHYLPINISPKKKGEFTMIMGNPGGTDRFLSSWGVDNAIKYYNPSVVKVRDMKLKLMKEKMDADSVIKLQYATKYAHTANYWKYYIGQTKALKRLKVKAEKEQLEAEFSNWLNQHPDKKEMYGEALPDLKSAYEGINKYTIAQIYFFEAIYRGPEIFSYAFHFDKLKKQLEDKSAKKETLDATISKFKEEVKEHFKDYNFIVDRNIYAAMMQMFYNDVPKDQQPAYLEKMHKKFKGDWKKYADYVFKKSIFSTPEKVNKFLDKPSAKVLKKDPALVAWNDFYNVYRTMQVEESAFTAQKTRGHRLFIAGIKAMNPDVNYAPDANFTMRVTYGTVQDYYPADAVHYDYTTHLFGVMQKEDPTNPEFIVPTKLKALFKAKDFGRWGENGKLVTDFLSTNDITGGNSGSPIMNNRGQLIGLAFDGNWEAMSGDIKFDPQLQRTINVDVRYVLFIIDKYANAQNLINELTIIKDVPTPVTAPTEIKTTETVPEPVQ